MTTVMRPMRMEDIPTVLEMDRLSFPTPWSARTYEFEIRNRDTSHLVVLEQRENAVSRLSPRALLRRWSGNNTSGPLIGYGGCWLIAGEAHISTIAVHPDYRGRGLGELLLVGMLQRALHLKGEYSVLEVRVSNVTAQALYRKHEYEVVGRRKGYYRDNSEDALLMEVRPLDAAYAERLNHRLHALRQRVQYIDQFTAK
ncbi:MAG: ribosomal protein S18-alanine N-acetyltransferase [Chloroflexi bacterium]|nr:ribosomal protein S18-alanine N-acetyltransferase [Chloroflexota bacterium]